jgi:hypothetical protein
LKYFIFIALGLSVMVATHLLKETHMDNNVVYLADYRREPDLEPWIGRAAHAEALRGIWIALGLPPDENGDEAA